VGVGVGGLVLELGSKKRTRQALLRRREDLCDQVAFESRLRTPSCTSTLSAENVLRLQSAGLDV